MISNLTQYEIGTAGALPHQALIRIILALCSSLLLNKNALKKEYFINCI